MFILYYASKTPEIILFFMSAGMFAASEVA